MAEWIPERACLMSDVVVPTAPAASREGRPYGASPIHRRRPFVLWLVIGVVLLIIAIAGGTIVHPLLFVLGVLALVAFFAGSRGHARI
jgi:hypothetical protein